jgi:SAM-dependent methyltransferase
MSLSTHLEREREFHDQRFASDPQRQGRAGGVARKYYSVRQRADACIYGLIRQHCKNKDVLDYGCAWGSNAVVLARAGARKVVAIDLSAVAVQQAQAFALSQGCGEIDFRVMNAEDLQFADESFDLVCGFAIIHHLDLDKAFAQIARVLRPGGIALFLEPLGHNPLINLYRYLTPGMRTPDEHPLRLRDLKLARRYFGQVDVHYFNLLTLLAVPFRKWSWFGGLVTCLHGCDQALFRLLPFTRRYAWNAVLSLARPQKASAVLDRQI